MNAELSPGVYVVAVSGGVDSTVLLHLLANRKDLDLIVAHFDHGIRPESAKDAEFVKELARGYKLKFETKRKELGHAASEAVARKARYGFLHEIAQQYDADAIVTAHHQDDIIETMMINLLRGTNRKGLSSLRDHEHIKRPLLRYSKQQIYEYARAKNILWHEDITNDNEMFLRNFIRNKIITQLTKVQRKTWLEMYERMVKVNDKIDREIEILLQNTTTNVKRSWLLQFPFAIKVELIAALLKQHGLQLNKPALYDTVTQMMTARPHTTHQLDKHVCLKIRKDYIQIVKE